MKAQDTFKEFDEIEEEIDEDEDDVGDEMKRQESCVVDDDDQFDHLPKMSDSASNQSHFLDIKKPSEQLSRFASTVETANKVDEALFMVNRMQVQRSTQMDAGRRLPVQYIKRKTRTGDAGAEEENVDE